MPRASPGTKQLGSPPRDDNTHWSRRPDSTPVRTTPTTKPSAEIAAEPASAPKLDLRLGKTIEDATRAVTDDMAVGDLRGDGVVVNFDAASIQRKRAKFRWNIPTCAVAETGAEPAPAPAPAPATPRQPLLPEQTSKAGTVRPQPPSRPPVSFDSDSDGDRSPTTHEPEPEAPATIDQTPATPINQSTCTRCMCCRRAKKTKLSLTSISVLGSMSKLAKRAKRATSKSTVRKFAQPRKLWQTAFGHTAALSSSFSQEQYELRSVFAKIDKQGQGEIEADDVGAVFHVFGIHVTREDLIDIFDELDEDVSGSISFEEFAGTAGPVYNGLKHFRITEEILLQPLIGLFTDHGKFIGKKKESTPHTPRRLKRGTSLGAMESQKLTETLKANTELDNAECIRLQTLHKIMGKVGCLLKDEEYSSALEFIKTRLTPEETEAMVTHDSEDTVDVFAVARILLLELANDKESHTQGIVDGTLVEKKRFANLIETTPDCKGRDVWRTLVRRFFIVQGLYAKCKDIIMLFGQRRMDAEMARISEIDEARKNRPCFFFPESAFRWRWDLLQVFFLATTAFFTPLRAGFDVSVPVLTPWFWFELISDFYFWSDIVVSFRSVYYDNHGGLVIDSKDIARRYLSTWFIIDVASCLPVQYVEYTMQSFVEVDRQTITSKTTNRNFKVVKVMKLFRLVKMLRLLRLKRLLHRYDDYLTEIMQSVMVIKMLLSLLFVMHLMACGWFAVGMLAEDNEFHQEVREVGNAYSRTSSVAEGWALAARFTEQVNLTSKYLKSLFYCITDFAVEIASTDYELVYVCVQHVVYEGIFAFITAAFASSIISGRVSETRRAEKMAEIREFLQKNKIPINLRQSVTNYYEHYFQQKSVFNERLLLADFPPRIRTDVINVMYRDRINNMPFFRGLSDDVSFRLCMALRPMMILTNEVAFVQGTLGQELYMIHHGQCLVYTHAASRAPRTITTHGDTRSPRNDPQETNRRRVLGCCCKHNTVDKEPGETTRDHSLDENHPEFGSSLGTLSTGSQITPSLKCHVPSANVASLQHDQSRPHPNSSQNDSLTRAVFVGSFFGELAVIEPEHVHDRTVVRPTATRSKGFTLIIVHAELSAIHFAHHRYICVPVC